MKKFLTLIISLVIVFSCFTIAYAADEQLLTFEGPIVILSQNDNIKVLKDDTYINFDDVEPQIINDRTMVPFRKIFVSLGVADEDIEWIPETKTVIAKKGNLELELQIDNNVAKKTISGETTEIILDSAPTIINNRTLVPVRFIAESMNLLVGWDAQNKTVIIIDVEKLQVDLENAIPKYFELISLQTEKVNTCDCTVNLNGELKYTSTTEKANNSTLKFTAKVNLKVAENSLYMDMVINFSGNGVIYDSIKELEFTKIDLKFIINENKIYVKSSLLDESTEGKWMAIQDESIEEIMKLFRQMENSELADNLFQLPESELDITTYSQLKMVSELLKAMLNDKNISITGTSTKRFEINIDLLDLLKSLEEYGTYESMDAIKEMKMKSSGTLENGVNVNSSALISADIQEEDERISITIDANAKINSYNKAVKIDIPSSSDIAL